MASALLRTSGRRASAFRRVVSAAAAPAAAPSGGEGLAVRRSMSLPPSPFRRLLGSAPQGDQPPKSLEEKVSLLHQTMKEVNSKVEKGYVVYASVQKLIEERKPYNRFVQWLCQVGAATFFVFVNQWRSESESRPRP